MLLQLFTISRNTFLECIRQPVFMVLVVAATILLILNPVIAMYTLDDDNKLLIDMGLSALFLTGMIIAGFCATSVITQEIENKTVLMVISKPVGRPLFILGKFLGVSTAIGVAYWVLTIVFLLTVRQRVQQTAADIIDQPVLIFGTIAGATALFVATGANYFYRKVFTSTFILLLAPMATLAWLIVLNINKDWMLQRPSTDLDPQLIIGLIMVFEAVLMLAALAIAASTRLGQVMTMIICAAGFVVGLVSEYFLGDMLDKHGWFLPFYVVTPNLQLIWPGDALTQKHAITGGYFGMITAYVGLMITAMLALAVSLFQTRDVS